MRQRSLNLFWVHMRRGRILRCAGASPVPLKSPPRSRFLCAAAAAGASGGTSHEPATVAASTSRMASYAARWSDAGAGSPLALFPAHRRRSASPYSGASPAQNSRRRRLAAAAAAPGAGADAGRSSRGSVRRRMSVHIAGASCPARTEPAAHGLASAIRALSRSTEQPAPPSIAGPVALWMRTSALTSSGAHPARTTSRPSASDAQSRFESQRRRLAASVLFVGPSPPLSRRRDTSCACTAIASTACATRATVESSSAPATALTVAAASAGAGVRSKSASAASEVFARSC
mmetsp:Transcript_24932/g.81633  ORF Transcript_24932/g.81633 Transcript_24932/m.81633 type:complete len:290 (+) Transcript_24932:1479-2348(+)